MGGIDCLGCCKRELQDEGRLWRAAREWVDVAVCSATYIGPRFLAEKEVVCVCVERESGGMVSLLYDTTVCGAGVSEVATARPRMWLRIRTFYGVQYGQRFRPRRVWHRAAVQTQWMCVPCIPDRDGSLFSLNEPVRSFCRHAGLALSNFTPGPDSVWASGGCNPLSIGGKSGWITERAGLFVVYPRQVYHAFQEKFDVSKSLDGH